jgi:hypothetical protein
MGGLSGLSGLTGLSAMAGSGVQAATSGDFLFVSAFGAPVQEQMMVDLLDPQNFTFQTDDPALIALLESFVGNDVDANVGDVIVMEGDSTIVRAHVYSIDPGLVVNTYLYSPIFGSVFTINSETITVSRIPQSSFFTSIFDEAGVGGTPDPGYFRTNLDTAVLSISDESPNASLIDSIVPGQRILAFKNGTESTEFTIASTAVESGYRTITATGAITLTMFASDDVVTFAVLSAALPTALVDENISVFVDDAGNAIVIEP